MTITKRLLTALVTTAVMATSATAVMAQDGANILCTQQRCSRAAP